MKKLSKILSVGLSLAMCASMVAPALALDITQEYIDSLEATTPWSGSGKPTSYVSLTPAVDENGNVDNVFNFLEDITASSALGFIGGGDVVLNMNGHTLTHTGNTSAIWAKETNLTVNGGGGTITGGNAFSEWSGAFSNNGGGISVDEGDLTVRDVTLTKNKADIDGAAIYAVRTRTEGINVTIENVTVTESEMGNGATICLRGYDDIKLTNVSVTGNTTNGPGGLEIQNSKNVSLTNVEISENHSNGGDMRNGTSVPWGGGIFVSNLETLEMDQVTITGNTAAGNNTFASMGGGLYVASVGSLSMKNTEITENTADCGGGVYAGDVGEITMDNVTVTKNTANGNGGGMYIASVSSTAVNATNTVIADNTGWGGQYANDMLAWAVGDGSSLELSVGPTTYKDQQFDGWSDSMILGDFVRVGDAADKNGIFGNSFAEGGYAWMTSHWITPPEEPETPDVPDTPVTDPTVEIDDVDVPLAGLFTRADAIGYLWEQSGSPEWELSTFEDVPEDHYWAVAIGWAQDMGIALPDQDGNFRPDDLVLRSVESLEISPEGELQEFLNRYAVYAGIELDEGELFIKLEGAWDDIIMGEEAQVIFNDFFAKLEAALAQAA